MLDLKAISHDVYPLRGLMVVEEVSERLWDPSPGLIHMLTNGLPGL